MSFESKVKNTYTKAIIKNRELYNEYLKNAGYKVKIIVELMDGSKLTINTSGVKGNVYLDDFDEEKIKRFIGHNLGDMRNYILKGKKYTSAEERVDFEFTHLGKKTTNDVLKGIKHWKPLETGTESAFGHAARKLGNKISNKTGYKIIRVSKKNKQGLSGIK